MHNVSLPPQKLRQPSRLLHLMVIVAMISISTILVLSGSGIYKVFERQLIEMAEKDAIQVGIALLQEERETMLRVGPQGQVDLAIGGKSWSAFDQRLRQHLTSFNIVKVNIFSPEWVILYSTELTSVGRSEFGNVRLNRSLDGQYDSHLVRQEKITPPGGDGAIVVDVVESYVPIRDEGGRVVGSFEVYRDVTSYRQELLNGVIASVLLLLVVLLGVFGVSYLFLRQAARRLQLAQEESRRFATHDELTGVSNRKEILEFAEIEISRMQRLDEQQLENCLALMMVDVDHLEWINKEYGRSTGDEVLRHLTRRLSTELRKYDAIGRFGGEEFLIILPANTRIGARTAAERLCQKVCNAPISVGQLDIEATVTIGLTTITPQEATLESAMKRALAALGQAKQMGCNCIAEAEPDIISPAMPTRTSG